MNYPIKIVGLIVDVHNITMYKADGDTLIIRQGDPRVKDLVTKMVPVFEEGGPQFYMLQAEDMQDKNHFADAEKKMGGVVRFFKMLKSKAKELLDKFVEPIEPMELGVKAPVHMVNGEVVEAPVVAPVYPKESERPLTKSAAAVAEIMASAVSSDSAGFSATDVEGAEETTVIAVLDDDTCIPGCEVLATQAQAVAAGVGSGTGMENFLRRAGMIKRGHSVEDLLKFIQKGELPLADDGCVLVYKLLSKTNVEGVFVDCHSGNVKQRVGSYVHMAEKLVDPNRGQDCSNGLHVARRDYLRSFGGNVCVLAKLAPEDVIAVPQYDARKLRAKGYHIIAELSSTDRDRVKNDKPMEDQVLLGNAIAGNHVGILELVEITQSKGGGLIVTEATGKEAPELDQNLTGSSLDHLPGGEAAEPSSVDARALAMDLAKPATPDTSALTSFVGQEVVAVDQTVAGVVAVAMVEKELGKQIVESAKAIKAKRPIDVLVQNYELTGGVNQARDLLEFKKAAKKSWTALGVDIRIWEKAVELVAKFDAAASLPKVRVENDDKNLSVSKPKANSLKANLAAIPKKPTVAPKANPVKAPVAKEKKMTQQEEMAKLVKLYETNPDKMNARAIYAFKQQAKKGWDKLGVTDAKFIKKITERAKL